MDYFEILRTLEEENQKDFSNDCIDLSLLHRSEFNALKNRSIDTITLSIANEFNDTVVLFRNSKIQSYYLHQGIRFFDYPFAKQKLASNGSIDFLFILMRRSQNISENLPEYYKWYEEKENRIKGIATFEAGKILFYFICWKYLLIMINDEISKKISIKENEDAIINERAIEKAIDNFTNSKKIRY